MVTQSRCWTTEEAPSPRQLLPIGDEVDEDAEEDAKEEEVVDAAAEKGSRC
jgi:hypothetical protein